ncbi:hypothetical protein CCMA1212_000924 [Trichoderma ghanense]|uniref:Uncharacterized protein n=1 Tax=Trichoderma ghanense TaxID=65468 RepID=A0ABY2HF98_9HYPO
MKLSLAEALKPVAVTVIEPRVAARLARAAAAEANQVAGDCMHLFSAYDPSDFGFGLVCKHRPISSRGSLQGVVPCILAGSVASSRRLVLPYAVRTLFHSPSPRPMEFVLAGARSMQVLAGYPPRPSNCTALERAVSPKQPIRGPEHETRVTRA